MRRTGMDKWGQANSLSLRVAPESPKPKPKKKLRGYFPGPIEMDTTKVELAIAWAKREITVVDGCRALGIMSTPSWYVMAARALASALQHGRLLEAPAASPEQEPEHPEA